jgi:hypothetical protein
MTGTPGADGNRIQTVPAEPDQARHGRRLTGAVAGEPEPLVRAWEMAYRQYGLANELSARLPSDDPAAAWQMATASWGVASAWREIASVVRLPWWLFAAVEAAAEAFETQARDWEARENNAGAVEGSPP